MAVQTVNTNQIRANAVTAAKCASDVIIAAGTNAFTADQSHGGFKITNLGTPSASTDAATKGYVDSQIQGLVQKPTARVVTSAALPACTYNNGTSGLGATLTGNSNAALSAQNGVTLVANDTILVNNQVAGLQNGLYVLTTVGSGAAPFVLTRHVDMDISAEFSGSFVPVGSEGTLNANSAWISNWSSSFTVGTTSVAFTNLAAANTYTGSGGVVVTGSVITVTYGSSVNTVCQGNDSRLSDARTPIGTTLTTGNIIIGVSGAAASVAMSGDATIASTGVVTLAAGIGRVANFIVRDPLTGTINGTNPTFTLSNTPVAGTEMIFNNGILQRGGIGNDYTISGSTVTFLTTAIPATGDFVQATYWK